MTSCFPARNSLLNTEYRLGFAPELIKLVVVPLGFPENMDNDIAIIKDEPAGACRSFTMACDDAFFLERLFDFVNDSFELRSAFAGADYKIICETADFAGVQQDDIDGLLFTTGFYCQSRDFQCFQFVPPT